MSYRRSPGLSCLSLYRNSQILSLLAETETHTGQNRILRTNSVHPMPRSQGLSTWLSGDLEGQWGRDNILLPPPPAITCPAPPPPEKLCGSSHNPPGAQPALPPPPHPAKATKHFLSPNFQGQFLFSVARIQTRPQLL